MSVKQDLTRNGGVLGRLPFPAREIILKVSTFFLAKKRFCRKYVAVTLR